MIHSRHQAPDEVFDFCDVYAGFEERRPLVAVPSSYNRVAEADLAAAGVNVVIYANQLLRSAYPAMLTTARSILAHGRSAEADAGMMPIEELLALIPGTR